jgi:hypothetical protein
MNEPPNGPPPPPPPPPTDTLPLASHSPANETVLELDLGNDLSSEASGPTSSPLARTHSSASTADLPADHEEWEVFPPLDKLTIFDFLDNLALPQGIEKINRTVVKQREKLRKQRDRVRQQYVVQKERVNKKMDVEMEKYKQKYSQGLDRLFEQWNDTRVVSTREKVSFVLGVSNILITGYLLGGRP